MIPCRLTLVIIHFKSTIIVIMRDYSCFTNDILVLQQVALLTLRVVIFIQWIVIDITVMEIVLINHSIPSMEHVTNITILNSTVKHAHSIDIDTVVEMNLAILGMLLLSVAAGRSVSAPHVFLFTVFVNFPQTIDTFVDVFFAGLSGQENRCTNPKSHSVESHVEQRSAECESGKLVGTKSTSRDGVTPIVGLSSHSFNFLSGVCSVFLIRVQLSNDVKLAVD